MDLYHVGFSENVSKLLFGTERQCIVHYTLTFSTFYLLVDLLNTKVENFYENHSQMLTSDALGCCITNDIKFHNN